ncbi:MAG: hypothetical protein R8K49_03015 [Mariprofundaceae bacterium]
MSQDRQIDQMLTNLDEMMHKVDPAASEEVEVAYISKEQSLSPSLKRFTLTQDMLVEQVNSDFPVDELCPSQMNADEPLINALCDDVGLAESAKQTIDLAAQVKSSPVDRLNYDDIQRLVAQTSADVSQELQTLIPNLIEQSMSRHLENILENKT